MAAPKYNCVLLSICLFMMLKLLIPTKATPTYTYTYCTNTYAPNPFFDYFFRFYRNKGTSKSIKGHILCRGDVTAAVCSQCLAAAVKEIRIRCPKRAEALIWYDECFLRYSHKYLDVDKIFPRVNLDDGNIDSSVDLGRFKQSLYGLLNRLVNEAAAAKKFAAGEAVVTEWRKVHGLVQCTGNLRNSECERCLRKAIGTLPNGKQGARALLPFCNVRYQLYPFFNLSSPPPPPPQSSGNLRLKIVLW
jgi:hypothetical protein